MENASNIYRQIIFPDSVPASETELSDLRKAMLDITPDCIKVISVEGRLLSMNKAGCQALGVDESSGFGMEWIPLLPESVHEAGFQALRVAAAGKSARFPGQSRSAEGTQYWDNLLTPLLDRGGSVLSILCISRDVTAQRQLELELEAAINRERLLAQEMRHRIKNVFSIVAGLITMTEREAAADSSESAADLLREKVRALARASDAAFVSTENQLNDSDRIELASLVEAVTAPYGDRCSGTGAATPISYKSTTTVALFLHELATNSMKYGALSAAAGRVEVGWERDGGDLNLRWVEHGGPQIAGAPARQGFGIQMLDRIARSSGGRMSRTWQPGGLVAELRLPIDQNA